MRYNFQIQKRNYMSKKAKQYSAAEKTKIVLETIKAEMTIAQISSKYGVHPTQIQAWKKRGIENLISGFQIKPQSKDPDHQDWHRQVKRDVNLSIERLKGMIYRIVVTIYQ
ncbi:MAG: transposase [Rickettsia endosymbiont of Argas persicus]